jgi:hypothetical protein
MFYAIVTGRAHRLISRPGERFVVEGGLQGVINYRLFRGDFGRAFARVMLLFLFLIVITVRPAFAQYRVLSAWRSGLGESFTRMSPSDRPLCEIVAKALVSVRAREPLSCRSPFYEAESLKRPRWSYIDKSRLLPLAKRLELLMDPPWLTHHRSETEEFTRDAESRIAAHSLTIALATVTLSGWYSSGLPRNTKSPKTTILRYERWGCTDAPASARLRVAYFVVEKPDLSQLKFLGGVFGGLNPPDDLFISGGLAYFDARTERGVDARWRRLLHPQPELVVEDVTGDDYYAGICRLIYKIPGQ